MPPKPSRTYLRILVASICYLFAGYGYCLQSFRGYFCAMS